MLNTLLTLSNSCQNETLLLGSGLISQPSKHLTNLSLCNFYLTYLSKVKVEETQSKKLQAHWEAIKEPVDWSGQVVGRKGIAEIKREECCAKSCPEQAKKKKTTLVAPSLMPVE